MLVGFGGFSIILALVHNSIRKHVFHDEHNLDTTFDAGGNVSLSLTAVTVASQLFWPGDILHSATLTTKSTTSGSHVFGPPPGQTVGGEARTHVKRSLRISGRIR
ncbi:urea-proton symporter dur3-like [Plakobranchus ocellatus]|uniref:Urea-proton symporter dur3-like n=1 Tax=Plakobranchus ocellatus TaxID=259542 RepID=A0AAV4ASI8_9GAST|nr:urea-proton symporter dur3-like [Plakobranchus ocellatus]